MIAGEDSSQLNSIQMDFVARRYDTFSETFTIEYYDDDQILQEVDLTGAKVQMQLKKRKSDANPIFNMDVAISGNEITISKHHTLMNLPKGKYWFDLEVKDSSSIHITWVHGRFIMVEHVTQYIETFLATMWTKFESFLTMPDVPKTIFARTFHSILSIITHIVYKFEVMITLVLKFTSLDSIVKKYSGFFRAILDIINVPKTVITTVFESIIIFIGKMFFYSSATFDVKVFFYDQGEPLDPYFAVQN